MLTGVTAPCKVTWGRIAERPAELREDMTCAHLRNSDLSFDDVGATLHHGELGDELLNLLLELLPAHFERGLKLPVLSSRLVGPLP